MTEIVKKLVAARMIVCDINNNGYAVSLEREKWTLERVEELLRGVLDMVDEQEKQIASLQEDKRSLVAYLNRFKKLVREAPK